MLTGKPQSFMIASAIAGLFIILLASCSVIPKDYPKDKPFVYKTNIKLEGNFTKDERDALESQLTNQLDDSMRARTVYKLFYKGINTQVLQKPPVFDSVNADRSVKFMSALLTSLGYFRDSIWYDTTMTVKPDTKPPQYRTTVNFTVVPGPQFKLDSVSHVINNNELQALTDATKNQTLLVKGRPFSKQLVAAERDRMTELFRDNGYMQFTTDELVGVWDTLNLALLRPTIDPFEQIRMLEELQRRRDTPTADIEMRLRPGYDVERLKKYFVGHTTIYPDFNVADTGTVTPIIFRYDNNFTFISYKNLFKKKFITQNIYFRRGNLYNQKRFSRTINRFNALGAWRLVNIEPIIRFGTDTVDFEMKLTPAPKYLFTTNLEGSFNSSNSIVTEENLFGIGANMQLTNRNFGRSSNRSTTTARYSTELDTKGEFVKTIQSSISHSIDFPKPVPNLKWVPARFRENFSTSLRFSLGNTERKDFFNLTSVTASWGYNFAWQNKTFSLKLPNIEYAYIRKRDSLIKFLNENPSLRDVFPQNGLVLSVQGGFSIKGNKGNTSQIFRTNIEESGLLTSLIDLKILDSLFKFIKIDAEYIRRMGMGKNELVFRTYVGAGFAMKTKERQNPNLPFFKQFSAGGPYSMRAWGIRTLGPGSTVQTRDSFPIRFGDFQFETNLEYRFPLFKMGTYLVSSCLFTDIGNVWFLRNNPDFPDGTLTAESFLRDLAVGMGTGLRVDFDFFRLRLDYGLKVKVPSPEPYNIAVQNKWFSNFNPLSGIIQLGINYPFSF
jgi:outer membrane protein insertion porin family